MADKKKPYYNWYASDFLGSPFVQSLEPLEEFCYRRLLDMQATSEDERITGDIKKMKAQCKHLATFPRIWEVIKSKFAPHPDGNGGLVNLRLMEILDDREEYLEGRSKNGKKGAEARWGNGKGNGTANGKAIGKQGGKVDGKTIASTSTSNSTSKGDEKGKEQGEPTDAAKRVGGPSDVAADLFADSYLLQIGNPYGWLGGDFPQLAKLRKRLGIGTLDVPTGWIDALANYFASPLSKFSLQHFATDYDTFKNGPLDRFGKPVNHVNSGANNGRKSKDEINSENARRLLSRLDSEAGRGNECGTDGSDSTGVSGAAS